MDWPLVCLSAAKILLVPRCVFEYADSASVFCLQQFDFLKPDPLQSVVADKLANAFTEAMSQAKMRKREREKTFVHRIDAKPSNKMLLVSGNGFGRSSPNTHFLPALQLAPAAESAVHARSAGGTPPRGCSTPCCQSGVGLSSLSTHILHAHRRARVEPTYA